MIAYTPEKDGTHACLVMVSENTVSGDRLCGSRVYCVYKVVHGNVYMYNSNTHYTIRDQL